jgi:hypothetical protein
MKTQNQNDCSIPTVDKQSEKIKTFTDAYLKVHPKGIFYKVAIAVINFLFAVLTKYHIFESRITYYKLRVLCKALNIEQTLNWNTDWSKVEQKKWYPLFTVPNFGFYGTAYTDYPTPPYADSRLCFSTQDTAEYVGKFYSDEYRTAMMSDNSFGKWVNCVKAKIINFFR